MIDLATKFAKTTPQFQQKITSLAVDCNQPALTVYGWWREYCDDCTAYDQSPVLFEFKQFIAERLALTA